MRFLVLSTFATLLDMLSLIILRNQVSSNIFIITGMFTTAQRRRSETETFILEDLFSSVLSQLKKYHPSGNLKFNISGIF